MNTLKSSNVSLKDMRRFLKLQGAKKIRIRGGHEIWSHRDLTRSIPLQTHIDPVPEFIMLEILNYFQISKHKMGEI
jgi:predicted RNA binding protein YcfA (HicA-like mRNA interferase family)